ncbi:MAG: trigger factor [Candidatus Bipolaricaulota bacterium]|nr:trigger factor [Candidatus Bipolaricaulota bacterium]
MEWFPVTQNDANYEIKERSATEVTVQVTVATPAIKNEIDSVYSRYGREAQIPGFRKGHVPQSFLDLRFGRTLFLDEAKKELEEKHLQEAVSFLKLTPVSVPKVESDSFTEEEFIFTAQFSVFPEVNLPEYRGLELSVAPAREVSEDDINTTLDQLRGRFATLSLKDGETVSDGDIVRVAEGEKEWDLRVEAENKASAKLIGAKVGDTVEIDFDLPDGKSRHASLSILGLKEITLPEIDDAFGKDTGFDSLAALRENIKENLTQTSTRERERKIKTDLLDHLVEQTDLPLPEAFVDERVKEDLEALKKELADPRSPLTFEEYLKREEKSEEELQAHYNEAVVRRLKRELVLDKLIEQEKIAIDDAELEEIVREEATQSGEDPLRFVAQLKANERWEDYRHEKVNARALDILYNEAKLIEEKK